MGRKKSYIPLVPEWDCIATFKGKPARLITDRMKTASGARRVMPPFFIPTNAIGKYPLGLMAVRGPFADHVVVKETMVSPWQDAQEACHAIGQMARDLFRTLPWKIRAQIDSTRRYVTLG